MTALAEPAPTDRQNRLASVSVSLNEAQVSLATVAAWLAKEWPADLFPVQPSGFQLSGHYTSLAELVTARHALEALGDIEAIIDHEERFPHQYGRATVRLQGGVSVSIQAFRDLWLQAFPADLCARDGHVRGPLVEQVPEGAALLCERCGGEFLWTADGAVAPVGEAG